MLKLVQTNRPMIRLEDRRRDPSEQWHLRADVALSSRFNASALLGVGREPWARPAGAAEPGFAGVRVKQVQARAVDTRQRPPRGTRQHRWRYRSRQSGSRTRSIRSGIAGGSTHCRLPGSYRNGPLSSRTQLEAASPEGSSLKMGNPSGSLIYRLNEYRNLGARSAYNAASGRISVGAQFGRRAFPARNAPGFGQVFPARGPTDVSPVAPPFHRAPESALRDRTRV